MTWFKVDDTLAFHAKVVAAGNPAMGLWVRAGAWCAQQLTDGELPDHMVATLGNRAQAGALVRAGLWEPTDTGYRFHEWSGEGRQPTRDEVEARRAEWREKKRRQRRGADGTFEARATPAPMSLGDESGTPPRSPAVPSRPDPSRSSGLLRVVGGRASSSSSGSGTREPRGRG